MMIKEMKLSICLSRYLSGVIITRHQKSEIGSYAKKYDVANSLSIAIAKWRRLPLPRRFFVHERPRAAVALAVAQGGAGGCF